MAKGGVACGKVKLHIRFLWQETVCHTPELHFPAAFPTEKLLARGAESVARRCGKSWGGKRVQGGTIRKGGGLPGKLCSCSHNYFYGTLRRCHGLRAAAEDGDPEQWAPYTISLTNASLFFLAIENLHSYFWVDCFKISKSSAFYIAVNLLSFIIFVLLS